VTGLIVADTPKYFSFFGQSVILILIQVGGLGIMTFSAALFLVFRQRLAVGKRRIMEEIVESSSAEDLKCLILFVLKMTFIVEAIGVLLLFFCWHRPGTTAGSSLALAVFHSISAFCNAGFSLFSDSLEGFRENPGVNIVIAALIIVGGLGFVVVEDIVANTSCRRGKLGFFVGINVHTRLVLVMTGALIVAGTLVIILFERSGSFGDRPLSACILPAFFQSVTARTAGFNTMDIGLLRPATLFFLIILMFIGASPGSTGGGIKTSTFAVLLLAVRSMIIGRDEVEVFGRTIRKTTVYKAISIVAISFFILVFMFLLLLATQKEDFLSLLFEAVSAFGTVGLSTGITAGLTDLGKVLIIVLMFVGRVGPLSLALVVGEAEKRARVTYPAGKVLIG